MLKQKEKGISLIALIITIIVIIILAAIVIFSGLNTPDRANLAKFMQEIADFRLAVAQDFMNKKAEYTIQGKSRSDAQIYYIISQGGNPDIITDINKDATKGNGYANIYTLSELGVDGANIEGTYAYLITDDRNVKEWKTNKKYYESNEKHFMTDEGDVFILSGYLSQENGSEKWYLNERTYLSTAINSAEVMKKAELADALQLAGKSTTDMSEIAATVNSQMGTGTISKQNFNGAQSITGVKITSGNTIGVGIASGANTTTITIEPIVEGASDGEEWYALIDGKYYKVNDDLTISSQAVNTEGSGGSTTIDSITASTGSTSIATINSAEASSGVGTVTIEGVAAGETSFNVVINGNQTFNNVGTIVAKSLAELVSINTTNLTVEGVNMILDGASLITATVKKSGTNYVATSADVIWTSSDEEIAKVLPNGVVICGNKTSAEKSDAIVTITCTGAGDPITCTVKSKAKVVYANNNSYNTIITGAQAVSSGASKNVAYNQPVIPAGFSAINTENATWVTNGGVQTDVNKGLVIMDQRTGAQFVWVPIDGTNVTYAKWCKKGTSHASTVDYITTGTGESAVQTSVLPVTTDNTQTYGGFWVGRYEAGIDPEMGSNYQTNCLKRDASGAPLIVAGALPWNYISWTQSKENAEGMYTGSTSTIQSGPLNGKQWDTTMKWYKVNGIDEGESSTSTAWGNYMSSAFSTLNRYAYISTNYTESWTDATTNGKQANQAQLLRTGATTDTQMLNISDMAGNLQEWTDEVDGTNGTSAKRIYRGGRFDNANPNYTRASFRMGSTDGGNVQYGFRVALYIK